MLLPSIAAGLQIIPYFSLPTFCLLLVHDSSATDVTASLLCHASPSLHYFESTSLPCHASPSLTPYLLSLNSIPWCTDRSSPPSRRQQCLPRPLDQWRAITQRSLLEPRPGRQVMETPPMILALQASTSPKAIPWRHLQKIWPTLPSWIRR